MNGETIIEKRKFVIYRGSFFEYKTTPNALKRWVKKYKKKGLNFIEQKLGNTIQLRMKKNSDTLIDGNEYEKDFNGIYKKISDDIENYKEEDGGKEDEN